MLSSLFTGVTGLNANGIAISSIGDNISNVNTVGFKASRIAFSDILSQAQGSSQIGRGVAIADISPLFTQGSFETTTNVLDMAIEGEGFFLMNESGTTYYSRAGQFSVDRDGYIVNPGGLKLQGYLYSAAGVATGSLGDVNISSLNSAPNQTANVSISANLNSDLAIPAAFNVNNPSGTSNFSTSLNVYDSLGNSHVITTYFRKSAEAPTGNTWQWYAVVGASDSGSGLTEVQAQGTLSFDTNGKLSSESAITYPTGGFDFSGGAAQNQSVAFNFGTSLAESGTGLDGVTQFGAESAIIFQNQDGYGAGSLKNISISQNGTITGVFTNGQTRLVAQVAVAKFIAPTDLTKMGNNLYAESYDSGGPVIGSPGSGGLGKVLSNTLEMSNVDLAEEFVKMISAQRGFQANARVITTSDDLLQELVNLKR
ncbi:MAG: flagellar hook protein FlgE [Nitrospirae bacterium]|nr:flagellar hook protein FlgE [Nitrospirota bacterium]